MHAMPVMLGVLAALAVAYRYYSAFLAAKAAALDDSRTTPAHEFNDGRNFHPTNRWVLFGHHFAAIAGAGPLIGPVLAVQFGFLPGLLWLVVGVCLAGAVQDMMVLALSTRRGGRSLAAIAREELGPAAGTAASLAILYIVVVALAGLGMVVVKALGGDQVALKAGNVLTLPNSAVPQGSPQGGRMIYQLPELSEYRFGPGPEDRQPYHEPIKIATPLNAPLRPNPDGPGYLTPDNTKRLVAGSAWGTFTIACTIPIALLVGFYMTKLRKGRIIEASIFGAVAVLGAVALGKPVADSSWGSIFDLSRENIIIAMGVYGFFAAILPVWLLLSPRDYLSSFLKIGTVALLVLGVLIVNPKLEAPAIDPQFLSGGGPNLPGPIFPYLFICIMCGAISGFHSLVASGTTPKMIDRESDVRMIGYGAMLMEGLVGVVALIAAASMPQSMYYNINISLDKRPQFESALRVLNFDPHGEQELVQFEQEVGESLHGRTGGAVTLAVGMAKIFESMPLFGGLTAYWYHFAIMFEALFILTTIDAGTRIARFLLQEMLGRIWAPLGRLDWRFGSWAASALVVFGWSYLIWNNSVDTIWPMFGLANQLLALIALCVVSTALIRSGRGRYAWATIAPMCVVAITTGSAGYLEIRRFLGMSNLQGWLNAGLTIFVVASAAIILGTALRIWLQALRTGPKSSANPE